MKKRFLSILFTIYDFFSDSNRENSDEENSNKESLDEENQKKKNLFKFFFLYIKMTNNYYQNNKKSFKKKHAKDTKVFPKKKMTKSVNTLVSNIETFLKERKKRIANMVVNDIRIF